MTALDNANFICGFIVACVSAPLIIIALPAMLQVLAGDWAAWNRLLDLGYGEIVFFAGVVMCLLQLVGVVLE